MFLHKTFWSYFSEIDPDIALLQEVGSIPAHILREYSIEKRKAYAGNGRDQKFHTVVAVKGTIQGRIKFNTPWECVNEQNESLDKSNGKSYFARVVQALRDGLMLASDFITDLMAKGRYTFIAEEAAKGVGQSVVATRAALRRLRKKGEIAMPCRGFWVIVPPEYRIIGCLPPEQFIPQLMEHLGESYYAGILTAAQYHGAAHHRPQLFQVVVAKNRPPIECGKVRVQFVARNNVADIPTMPFRTPRGDLNLSIPEATAFDLIGYPEHSAGLDNVATVLSELAERLDNRKLAEIAKLSPIVWSQRLGYLLDLVGAGDKTSDLAEFVGGKVPAPAPLDRAKPFKGAEKKERWRIMINTEVEADV